MSNDIAELSHSFKVDLPNVNGNNIDRRTWLRRLAGAIRDTGHEAYEYITLAPHDGVDPTAYPDILHDTLQVIAENGPSKKIELITHGRFLNSIETTEIILKAIKIYNGLPIERFVLKRDHVVNPEGSASKFTMRDIMNFRFRALHSVPDFTINVELPPFLPEFLECNSNPMSEFKTIHRALHDYPNKIDIDFVAPLDGGEYDPSYWFRKFWSYYLPAETWPDDESVPRKIFRSIGCEWRSNQSFRVAFPLNTEGTLVFGQDGILYKGDGLIYNQYEQLTRNEVDDLLGHSTIPPSTFD